MEITTQMLWPCTVSFFIYGVWNCECIPQMRKQRHRRNSAEKVRKASHEVTLILLHYQLSKTKNTYCWGLAYYIEQAFRKKPDGHLTMKDITIELQLERMELARAWSGTIWPALLKSIALHGVWGRLQPRCLQLCIDSRHVDKSSWQMGNGLWSSVFGYPIGRMLSQISCPIT